MMTKIVSWNVNSIRVRLPHLVQLKETIDPDVIMLQETSQQTKIFHLITLRKWVLK